MEPRFGTDFSQVRVRTDAQAAASAQSVNALAYTVGSDLVFGSGQYKPETNEGQRLLAHELTHVVQQSNASIGSIQLTGSSTQDTFEREAECTAESITQPSAFDRRGRVGPISRSPVGLHRADAGSTPSTGTKGQTLQISGTTFDDAAQKLAAILVENNLREPARIIVINGANIHVFDEKGNAVSGTSSFRIVHEVLWPIGVFQMTRDRRLHAVIQLPNGGYSLSPQGAHASTAVDMGRDIDNQEAFNSAVSGGQEQYFVVPKVTALATTTVPPPTDVPEFVSFTPKDRANLDPWPAAVIPLTASKTPQIATVHSTGSFMMHLEKNQGARTIDRVLNLMEPTHFRWEVLKLDDTLQHVTNQKDVTKLTGVGEGYARRTRNIEADRQTLLGEHPERQSVPEKVMRQYVADQMAGSKFILAMAGQTVMTLINTITNSPDNPNIEDIIDVPWDKPGDYFVRCLATPIASDTAKYRRATSVAGMMVSVFDIASVARESLLSGDAEREKAQEAAKSNEERLAELKHKQELGEGDQAELGIQIHLLQARIDYEHEKITAAGDTRAMNLAELNYIQAQIAYFTGPDAPQGNKQIQEQKEGRLKELRNREREVSNLLERADNRLGAYTKYTAMMSAVLVDEATGNRQQLTFSIGERTYINANELEVRIADITTENGRVFNGTGSGWMGKGRTEAWQNAMNDMRRNLNRGRGWMSFRSPPPYASLPLDLPNPMQLQISGIDQFKELVDDAAHAATLVALLAAPFTGGASLGILAVLAPIQAASSLYNLVNRAMYDELTLDTEAVMDLINIGTFGLGHIGEANQLASRSVQIVVASGKVALRLLEGGMYIVLAYQTYQQLMAEGPPDEDPRARQRRRLMVLLNLVEAASIPIAEKLWPEGTRPTLRPGESHSTERASGSGESAREGEGGQPASREGTPTHPSAETAKHLTPAPPELVSALPVELQGKVSVVVDSNLQPGTVRVHYELDANGLVREVSMRVGKEGVKARDIELHVPTARMMNRYRGFSGRVRRLLDQITNWLRLHPNPPIGSRAWEAKLELEKLPAIIKDRANRLESGNLDPATEQQLMGELENLQSQLAEHARTLDTMDLDPGRGFVAAEGVSKGRQLAAERGYPDPPKDYVWRLRDGQLEVVNQGDGPKLVFDPETKSFSVDTGVRKEESFGPQTTKEQAFKDLGGDDPTSPFGKFVETLRKEGIITSPEEVREAMGDPSNLNHRTVRSNVKEDFKDKLMAHITDARRLSETRVYKEVLNATHDPKQALKAASEVEMIRISDMLESADKGSIAERWYQQMYGQEGSKKQVSISKEKMSKQGITLEQDRKPDRIEGDTMRELKNVSAELGSRDKEEIDDYMKLVGSRIMVDNEPRQINRLTVSFLDPHGVRANLEWMQGKLATSTGITFEIFNASGARMEITSANMQFLSRPEFSGWLGLKD
jgi:hypothetical protein